MSAHSRVDFLKLEKLLQYTSHLQYTKPFRVQHSIQYTVCNNENSHTDCTVYSVQCTVHSVHCILYTMHCTPYRHSGISTHSRKPPTRHELEPRNLSTNILWFFTSSSISVNSHPIDEFVLLVITVVSVFINISASEEW